MMGGAYFYSFRFLLRLVCSPSFHLVNDHFGGGVVKLFWILSDSDPDKLKFKTENDRQTQTNKTEK